MTLRLKLVVGYCVLLAMLAGAGLAGVYGEGFWGMAVLLVAAGVFLAGFLFWVWWGMVGRLRALVDSLHAMEGGKLDVPAAAAGGDELGQLGAAFNGMRAAIEEMRRVERERLLRTQETTRSAIDALPHAVAVVSPEGKIELVNRVAESLFGLAPGVVAAGTAPEWLTGLIGEARRTMTRVKPEGYKSAVQIFDKGRELFFLPQAIPLFDAEGKMVGITVMLEDATELRQVEEAKSGLLAMVSHELKTPLTSIQMSLHLLMEDPKGTFSARERELLQTAGEDADRLNVLIQRLLDKGRR